MEDPTGGFYDREAVFGVIEKRSLMKISYINAMETLQRQFDQSQAINIAVFEYSSQKMHTLIKRRMVIK